MELYTVIVVMCSVHGWWFLAIMRAPSVCFTAAGMDKIEVKNQQIQTEIVNTVDQHVQAGSTVKQQGVYTTHCNLMCHISK